VVLNVSHAGGEGTRKRAVGEKDNRQRTSGAFEFILGMFHARPQNSFQSAVYRHSDSKQS